jgi:hypothetical protein
MVRFKLTLEHLNVDTFTVSAAPMRPRPGVANIAPDYSAQRTCPEGACAPYTQGGLYQQTCGPCTFTCLC